METWDTYLFDSEPALGGESTRTYRDFDFGGSTVYMPTFNKNNNSLDSDINGTYAGPDGDRLTDYDRYGDYDTYEVDEQSEPTDVEYHDPDDDYGYLILPSQVHVAQKTLTSTVISMEDWTDRGSPEGNYWVYDTDGWAYWAAPIKSQTATGLLIDEIVINQEYDGEWYYGVNVVCESATAEGWYNLSEMMEDYENYEDYTEEERAELYTMSFNAFTMFSNIGAFDYVEEPEEPEEPEGPEFPDYPEVDPDIKFGLYLYTNSDAIGTSIKTTVNIAQSTRHTFGLLYLYNQLELSKDLTYKLYDSEGVEVPSQRIFMSNLNYEDWEYDNEDTASISTVIEQEKVYELSMNPETLLGEYSLVVYVASNPNYNKTFEFNVTEATENNRIEYDTLSTIYGESLAEEALAKLGTNNTITVDGAEYYVLDHNMVKRVDDDKETIQLEEAVLLWSVDHITIPAGVEGAGSRRTYFNGSGVDIHRWSDSYMRNDIMPAWLSENSNLEKVAVKTVIGSEGYLSDYRGLSIINKNSYFEFTADEGFLLDMRDMNTKYDLIGSTRAASTGQSEFYWTRATVFGGTIIVMNGADGQINNTDLGTSVKTWGIRPAVWVAL